MGRRAHKPDPSQRRQVEALAAYGIPETDIARVVGIDPKTLRKRYREELDLGETKANAQVAGFLFTAAKNGNVTAQIFWLKTRARWRETPTEMMPATLTVSWKQEPTDAELLHIVERSRPQTPPRLRDLTINNQRSGADLLVGHPDSPSASWTATYADVAREGS
jgi:hypothetical protein